MNDRRESADSRLDMLEFRVTQIDSALKDLHEDRDEILTILRKMEIEQSKTQTIVGATTWVAGGLITAIGIFFQNALTKLFHW